MLLDDVGDFSVDFALLGGDASDEAFDDVGDVFGDGFALLGEEREVRVRGVGGFDDFRVEVLYGDFKC